MAIVSGGGHPLGQWNTELRVVFADDHVHDWSASIGSVLRAALRTLHPDLTCKLTPIVDFEVGRDRLASDERIDIALIDVTWSENGADSDDLVLDALKRPETVTVLISGTEAALSERLYDYQRAGIRPHAVIHKESRFNARLWAAMLESAFSTARIPLRSRSVNSDVPDRFIVNSLPDMDELAATEMSCSLFEATRSVRLEQVGGGMSGATTVFSDIRYGDGHSQRVLLKCSRDFRSLASELKVYDDLVKQYPANTFASPDAKGIVQFGGWYAFALDRAVGDTVSSCRSDFIARHALGAVFPRYLFETLARRERGQAVDVDVSSLMSGEACSLDDGRFRKFRNALASMDVPDHIRLFFNQEAASAFSGPKRKRSLTLCHGDLHTRNVLVSFGGDAPNVTWIDAASMKPGVLWSSDLSRFCVWLAAEMLDPLAAEPDDLLGALALGALPRSGWAAQLRGDVEKVLDWARGYVEGDDLMDDWAVATGMELMRVAYSVQTFDRSVRLAAAECAYAALSARR